MSDELDSVDLIALARRGQLSKADARRLEAALARSAEDRLLKDAARGFDLEASVGVDDAAHIERLAAQFQGGARRPRLLPRTVRVALSAAAAFLFLGALVGAIKGTSGLFAPKATGPAAASARSAVVPVTSIAPKQLREPGPVEGTAPVPESSSAAPSAQEQATPTSPRAHQSKARALGTAEAIETVGSPSPEDARSLFGAANFTRSRGDTVAALALYHRLEVEYPAAPETLAARISIGMLQLQRGQPGAALSEFRAYRLANARALRAEALWGEAEALRALGRHAEERAALEELLREYPGSAYEPAARKHLEKN